MQQLLVWRVGSQNFALPFSNVMRVVRAAAVMPAPLDSPFVCGMLDIQGKTLPVVDVRKRFGLPERCISLTDHFIIACTPNRSMVLWVDIVEGLVERQESESEAQGAGPDGVARLADGMLLVHDLEQCLSTHEGAAPGVVH